ncbi:MAG: P2 family phage major capsid protein, partial [Acinetobacter baumannii]|nr:P2 family phage major capsid protein [Acinetobacter baumannii]
MRTETRTKYNKVMVELAKLNGVENVSQKFNVTPTVQQKLEDKIQESSEFLKKINIFLVAEQSGSAVGLGISRPIASRTNTDAGERQATDPTGMDERF